MTFAEYIPHHAGTPENLISAVEIRYNTRNGWYRAYGKWHGQTITAHAPSFPQLQAVTRDRFRLCLPARKDLVFSRTSDGIRFALLQGYLPGNAVVDMSAYKPPKAERK